MSVLVIDFETHDPYIDRGLGAGWVFMLNDVPNNDFEVLGAALIDKSGERYETSLEKIREAAENASCLVMHNAQYDLGCLYAIGAKVKDIPVIDTMIAGKLYNSTLMSYSLDNLADKYLYINKSNNVLTDAVWEADLYPWLKKEENAKLRAEKKGEVYVRERPEENKLEKFCKKNMKLIQEKCPEAMAQYAIDDTKLTLYLWKFFKGKGLCEDLVKYYSFMSHICIDYRRRGVRIDLERAREVDKICERINLEKLDNIYKRVGYEFNINSIIDLPKVFDELGIPYPRTPKGNPSITSQWLKTQTHEIAQLIIDARKSAKMQNDFIKKVIEMQEYTQGIDGNTEKYGRVFPELNILQAKTGRFSSSSPNIQQIPSRDELFGPLVRSVYVPEEGETWYSLDFSNQEGRLQIHYAYLLNCEGANELKLEFDRDPTFDMHGKVAGMAEISRTEAKVVNLGISYGMGNKKLAIALGQNENHALTIREKYDNMVPYLNQLNDICMTALQKRGYIKTVGGRKVHLDPPFQQGRRTITFEYRALNKLIQGSAADQTMIAMKMAYDAGIKILFPVHDELNLSSANKQEAIKLKEIMETCIDLSLPMYTDIGEGETWADAK